MQVLIPSPLRSYTQEENEVAAEGDSLAELLQNLEQNYPGIRFRMIDEQDRIRQHIKIYVDKVLAERLAYPLQGSKLVQIVCALSGG